MQNKLTSIHCLAATKPNQPVFAFRPATLRAIAKYFLAHFNGKIMYAVKTNPEKHVLRELYQEGIQAFDVSSLAEITHIKSYLPDAELFFMHPVKSREAIKEAYFTHGVRQFVLDSTYELQKILEETNHASDLTLFVRLSIPNTYAEYNLSEKFGINLHQANTLVRETSRYANRLGICFHVGSQCMHPNAYRIAIRLVAALIEETQVKIDLIDVGGGFPSIYPGMVPPAMIEYFNAIHEEFAAINKNNDIELLCEPGRALVAESTSVIVRVEMRKEDKLYINDGTYGSLFDAGTPHFIFPVRLLRSEKSDPLHLQPYSFYGPTCDTLDFMKGPFYLPEDIQEGDYIEIGQLGAYGRVLATSFNGFTQKKEVILVDDAPLMTLYGEKMNEPKVELPQELIAV